MCSSITVCAVGTLGPVLLHSLLVTLFLYTLMACPAAIVAAAFAEVCCLVRSMS